eukprot:CAMPEP_0168737646 /NCGR_PEP_ID=MMETSP0724-20121128/10505_1 /TAXON_ID=265536 /ORGANISM="Amphiprora sp., Strain CCMP467" /LENGTH=613 /DNA_ID=CAMNT_0008784925 /DNA_START=420 /DNA_END=2261 /DNA_ORIENTATION=-
MDLQVYCIQEDGTHLAGRKLCCGWKGSLGDWVKVHRAKNCPYEMITCNLEGCRVGDGDSRRKPFKYMRCRRDAHLKARHLEYFISQQNKKHSKGAPQMLQIGNGTPASVVNGTYYLDGFNQKGTAIYKKQTLWNGTVTHVVIGKYLHQRNKSACTTKDESAASSTNNTDEKPAVLQNATGNNLRANKGADLGPLEPTAFETTNAIRGRETKYPPLHRHNQYSQARSFLGSDVPASKAVRHIYVQPPDHQEIRPNMAGMHSWQNCNQNGRQQLQSWTAQGQYQTLPYGPTINGHPRGTIAPRGDVTRIASASSSAYSRGAMAQFNPTATTASGPCGSIDGGIPHRKTGTCEQVYLDLATDLRNGSQFPSTADTVATTSIPEQYHGPSTIIHAPKPPPESIPATRRASSLEDKKQEEQKHDGSRISVAASAASRASNTVDNEKKEGKRYWYISIVPLGCTRGDVNDIDLYRCRADETSQFPPKHGWKDLRSPRIGSNRYPLYEHNQLVVNIVGYDGIGSAIPSQKRSADSSALGRNKRARANDAVDVRGSRLPTTAMDHRSASSPSDDEAASYSSSLYDSDSDDDSEEYSSSSQSFEHDHFDIFDSLSSSSNDAS